MNVNRGSASSAELEDFDRRLLFLSRVIDSTIAEGVRSFAAGEPVSAAWRVGLDNAAREAHVLAELSSVLMGTNERIAAVPRLKILAILDDALSVSASLVALDGLPPAGARERVPGDLLLLAEIGRVMLRDAVEAGIDGDADLAHEVCARDAKADSIHGRLVEDARRAMRADPERVAHGTAVLLVASGLERIARLGSALAEAVLLRALRGAAG